jgi:oxygen-independent coproporphyrinogen-3 oxidase
MAGIYLHIPFCKKACHYCDFHFSTNLSYKQQMVEHIVLELEARKQEVSEPISSIYFGGGTPSLLTADQLDLLLQTIYTQFEVNDAVEITLEANPDDMNQQSLMEWHKAGVNRLSVGIQSFEQEDLDWMNRAHSASESLTCIKLAKEQGFDSFSVDLIYGLPNMTNEDWLLTLEQAMDLGVNHLSTYCLTIEQKTALAKDVALGKFKPLSDEKQSEQFIILNKFLERNDWEHYEISNSCKSGNYAKHNTAYWQNNQYLGVGPSAHSFNGESRKWNIANNNKYMKLIKEEGHAFELETLTKYDQINEYILTGLRTKWGMSLDTLKQQWGFKFEAPELNLIAAWCMDNLMKKQDNVLTLTAKGWLYADKIASDLFTINS